MLNETFTNGTVDTSVPCGLFFFIIYGPLHGIVCALGLVGNTLSVAVLARYSPRSRRGATGVATYLLQTLAVADSLFLATAAGVQIYPAMILYFDGQERLEPIYPTLQAYAWPAAHTAQMAAVWMVVLLAANRYVAVCRPLHAPRLCTIASARLQVAVTATTVCLYNVPRFFEYRYVNQRNVGLASMRFYNILYENISYCLFVFLIPLVILVVVNVHLIHDLHIAQRCRQDTVSSSHRRRRRDEANITLVMVIIIVAFIICQTPASLNQILYYTVSETSRTTCSAYLRYSHISNLLVTTNSSLNFVVYCLFRRQFQRQLRTMLSCKGKPRGPSTILLRAWQRRNEMSQDNNSQYYSCASRTAYVSNGSAKNRNSPQAL